MTLSRKTAVACAALMLTFGTYQGGEAAPSQQELAANAKVQAEILARQAQLSRVVREKMLEGKKVADYEKARNDLWWDVVTPDFNEFDAYLPFRSEPARMLRPQIQMAEDIYQRIPTGRERQPGHNWIKVYDDVAITSNGSVKEGDLVKAGGPRVSLRKTTMVWWKIDGQWRLAFCHCEWTGSLDGISWLGEKALPEPEK